MESDDKFLSMVSDGKYIINTSQVMGRGREKLDVRIVVLVQP